MTTLIKAGLQIVRNGKASYVGTSRLAHNSIEVHSADGDLKLLSPDEFRREVAEGSIALLVPAHGGGMRPLESNWKEVEREKDRSTRVLRQKILRRIEELETQGTTKAQAVRQLADFCRSLGLKRTPSERTVREWRRLAREHESSLSPRWGRCGNRHQGPDDLLLEIMKEVVSVAYLGSDLTTLSGAWRTVEARYHEEWTKRHPGIPAPRHSVKKLKNFIRAMPWAEVIKIRVDGRTARAITRRAVRTHDYGIFWDCVEMDAALLNIFVRDEQGNEIGRPVLYVAIDRATGYVVGLHVTIQKPSTLPFVECLRFMYFPKPDGFDEKYGLKQRIEVFGKPILLLVDNGSEFVGKTAVAVVEHLFGDSARCKPMTPEEKPHIERFIGALKTFLKTLPGATTSSVTGESRPLRAREELLNIETLRGEIYRFVYDSYCVRVNELRSKKAGKAVAPVDIWKSMSDVYMQPLPVSLAEFERTLYFKREYRLLQHDGIQFNGWNYHSDELASLYSRHGPGRYEFSYSELDATTIYVFPPSGGDPVVAFEKVLQGTACDRTTARVIKKQIAAEKEILNSRSFAFALAEYGVRSKKAKLSRSRAEQARIDDLIRQAAEHTQKMAPRNAHVMTNTGTSHAEGFDIEQMTPRGRKKGAFL